MAKKQDIIEPIIDEDELLPLAPPLTPHGDISLEEMREDLRNPQRVKTAKSFEEILADEDFIWPADTPFRY